MTDTTELRRLREYADLMPKAGWGWVTPGPGRRPIRLEAEGEVLARGIDEMAVAEYLGLVSPVSVLALLDELEQLRAHVTRHAEVMAVVVETIADAKPKAGFYHLRDWVVTGLIAAEGNFAVALTADPRAEGGQG